MTHPPGTPEARLETAVRDSAGAWSGRRFVVTAAVIAVLMGVVSAGVAYKVSSANAGKAAAQSQAASAGQNAADVAGNAVDACKADPAAAARLHLDCKQAAQVLATPVPGATGATGATGDRGPGPTQDQIAGAVAAYLVLHPVPAGQPGAQGQNATATQVLTAVGDYLAQNPAVTGAQLAQAVSDYLAAHPPPPGRPGDKGDTGSTGASGTPGTPGSTGASGANGANGSPAASQTLTLGGTTYDCPRDAGSPDTAPTYTCAPRQPPPSSTTATPPPPSPPPLVPLPTP